MMAFKFACGDGMCFAVILVGVVCGLLSAGMMQVRFDPSGL
jgi:hypothetical protein